MRFDLKNLLNLQPSIIPQAASGDVNGTEIDTANHESCAVFGFLDDVAEGSFKVQETDTSGSGYVDVPDSRIQTLDGTNDTTGVASNIVTLGVITSKRYLRVVFTHTTTGDIAAGIVLGNALISPTGANS